MKDIKNIDAYPLCWPDGYPRTRSKQTSRFKNRDAFSRQRDQLINELRLLGARSVILSTNIPIRKDGLPYADFRAPDDSGVAVYFKKDGDDMVLACDKWRSVQENVQALNLTVEALRGLDRWGASEILNRVFRGFAALPAPIVTKRPWRDVLNFNPGLVSIGELKVRYHSLAKELHPDHGGSAEQFAELQAAYQEALGEAG